MGRAGDAGPPLDDVDPRPRKGRKQKAARAPGPGRAGHDKRSLLVRLVRLALGLLVLAGILGAAGLAGVFLYYGSDPNLPTPEALRDIRLKQVSRIRDRTGQIIGEVGAEIRTVVPYGEIPKALVDAGVAAEDAEYFHHAGLDYRGMLRAFVEDVIRGRPAQGGSTITQQVVKRLLLSPERTLRRKVQEILLARQLDEKLSKEQVLALYLNQIYYGHGRYGCEEAARFFFGKSVRKVGLAEAALLAGLPQSPERLSPRKHPEAAKTRQRYVLAQMAQHGYIDAATAEKLAAEPIRLVRDPFPTLGVAPEATDTVGRLLAERLGPKAGEMGVTADTTIDARLQELARQAVERGLEDLDARQGFRGPSGHLAGKALEKRREELRTAHANGVRDGETIEAIVERVDRDAKNPKLGKLVVDLGATRGVVDLGLEARYAPGSKPLAERFAAGDLVRVRPAAERGHGEPGTMPVALEIGPQAAMVVLNPQTRQVLALVGGYGYRAGGFDRSQRAKRQPGSAFKPFVYAAAIDSGKLTAASIVNDSPDVYELWKPQNYEREEFRGPVRLRTALAQSINTVAIKVLSEIGIPQVKELVARMGITSPIPNDIGLSLALGSSVVTPLELANAYATFASGGQRADSRLVVALGGEKMAAPAPTQALRPEVAYVLVSMMKSVIEEGTARAAAGKLRRPAAGKTGTSNGQRDAWFVGFTPDLLAAVWVGFDDMHKLGRGEAGAKSALPIWVDFMTKALAGRPANDFPQPPGVVVVRIDRTTGLPPAPGSEGVDEVFIEGTAPAEQSPGAADGPSADKLLLGE